MAAFHDYLAYGKQRAKTELASDDPAFPAPDDAGTVLKYALFALLTDDWGDAEDVRRRVRAGTLTRRALETAAREQAPALLRLGGGDAVPLSRVIDLAVDALLSERLCPELRLASAPRHASGSPLHALVFSAFPHVTNELYPLMVDAYVAGLEGGEPIQVVGVHEGWLDSGMIRRAMLFDETTLGLLEADLAAPVAPRSAQALVLNLAEEHACHARIERALPGVRMLNPLAGAQRLDDKDATATIWQQAGLPIPRFLALANVHADEGWAAVERFAAQHGPLLVIKPLDGTEGRGVSLIDMTLPEERERAKNALTGCLAAAGGIVAEQRGSLRYAAANGPVRCTARVNVCWDGARAWAESGYAQVAASPVEVASAGRGGRLVTLTDLWAHLCRPDGGPYHPTASDWTRLRHTVEAGATALARALGDDMPALVGIDVLLDADGDMQPVLLEANPRPAGLSHSRLITPGGPTDEPGVSLRLWEAAQRKRCHPAES